MKLSQDKTFIKMYVKLVDLLSSGIVDDNGVTRYKQDVLRELWIARRELEAYIEVRYQNNPMITKMINYV